MCLASLPAYGPSTPFRLPLGSVPPAQEARKKRAIPAVHTEGLCSGSLAGTCSGKQREAEGMRRPLNASLSLRIPQQQFLPPSFEKRSEVPKRETLARKPGYCTIKGSLHFLRPAYREGRSHVDTRITALSYSPTPGTSVTSVVCLVLTTTN